LFLSFGVLFLTLFLIFPAALVSHYVAPFTVPQNIFSQRGSVATTVGPSLLIVILHTFQNPSITALRKKQSVRKSGGRKPTENGTLKKLLPATKGETEIVKLSNL
jgi:hypothetical protein